MLQRLHKNAKTNYLIREYIKSSPKSNLDLSLELNLNIKTIRKWKCRENLSDKSSKPIHLRTKITDDQENLIVYERRANKRTVFEIEDILNETIPNLYSMKIYRILDRWGLSILPKELKEADRLVKKFRKYTIGYLHIDTIYTPKFALIDGTKKRWYVFTCIDRVSKIAFVWISERRNKNTGEVFLKKVLDFYPYKINYILTDNGGEFSYNFIRPSKRPKTRLHPFDNLCKLNKIQHRTIKFAHPWTNGMVERFNQKIKLNVIRKYLFVNIEELDAKLIFYVNNYNFNIKLRQLNMTTPARFTEENYRKQLKFRPQRIVI